MEKKAKVYGLDGEEIDLLDLPEIFYLNPRKDLVSRAVISLEMKEKQQQGRDRMAGRRNTATSWGSGFGVARAPRRKGSGYPSARNAAFVPGVVGGRLTHPPRVKKVLIKKINRKERRLAFISAVSATGQRELVSTRGHLTDKILSFPLIVDDKIQTIKKTSKILEVLKNLGIINDIVRVKTGKKIRSGKGKRRGRRFKKKRSVLIVITENLGIYKAARNIAGVSIVSIDKLNCRDLAPGSQLGGLTLWTQSAFNELNKIGVI
ncbi:MAG: 50S ribosomal protein L4 [Promethearchaeota archaeon]